MHTNLLTIKVRNAYSCCCFGGCLSILGFLLGSEERGIALLPCAALLLLMTGLALIACLSHRWERDDEMSVAHDGQAASFSLKWTLIGLGMLCCFGIMTGAMVRLDVVCCLALGLGLLLYGVSFAVLERE